MTLISRTITGISGSGTTTLTLTFDGSAAVVNQLADISYDPSIGDTLNSSQIELETVSQVTVDNQVIIDNRVKRNIVKFGNNFMTINGFFIGIQ